jgi:hypothetical protein
MRAARHLLVEGCLHGEYLPFALRDRRRRSTVHEVSITIVIQRAEQAGRGQWITASTRSGMG